MSGKTPVLRRASSPTGSLSSPPSGGAPLPRLHAAIGLAVESTVVNAVEYSAVEDKLSRTISVVSCAIRLYHVVDLLSRPAITSCRACCKLGCTGLFLSRKLSSLAIFALSLSCGVHQFILSSTLSFGCRVHQVHAVESHHLYAVEYAVEYTR